MPFTIDIPESRTAPETENTLGEDSRTPVSGGLAEVAEFYRQLGFDAGYSRAAADQLEFSVVAAEQVLREHGDSVHGVKDVRRLLYAFVARMDRRLSLFANLTSAQSNEGYMEGGLGI